MASVVATVLSAVSSLLVGVQIGRAIKSTIHTPSTPHPTSRPRHSLHPCIHPDCPASLSYARRLWILDTKAGHLVHPATLAAYSILPLPPLPPSPAESPRVDPCQAGLWGNGALAAVGLVHTRHAPSVVLGSHRRVVLGSGVRGRVRAAGCGSPPFTCMPPLPSPSTPAAPTRRRCRRRVHPPACLSTPTCALSPPNPPVLYVPICAPLHRS